MPNVIANGISIYYEFHPATNSDPTQPVSQDSTPLLLIMGLGLNSLGWYKNLPGLRANRNVITFDNRGTGRSSKPDQPYSIKQMAADTAALLDAIGVRRAHVFGYSMGSLIAQEVALNYPQKVKSLILGASTPGGIHGYIPRPEVSETMLQRGWVRSRQAADMIIPILYSREFMATHPEEIARDTQMRRVYPTPPFAYRRQLLACVQHSTYNRLDGLQMPTLVFTGSADQLVLPQNSRVLAKRIPRAELVIISGKGHYLPSEDPQITSQVVLDFLDRHFPGQSRARAA